MARLAVALLVAALLAVPAAAGQKRLVVVVDPGHDLRANPQTEPIGPGSSTRKIKDGGGTRRRRLGLTRGRAEPAGALRLRSLLERAGVQVVMTRTRTAGTSIGNIARARIANRAGAALFLRIHADGSTDPARSRHAHAPSGAPRAAGPTTSTRRASARRESCRRDLLARSASLTAGSRSGPTSPGFNWADVPGDPRRDGLHDESDGGSSARHLRVSASRRARALPRDASLPRARAACGSAR